MLKLDLRRDARDLLNGLPPKQFRQVMTAVLKLTSDPYPHDSKQLKASDYRSASVGEYRIIYLVENDTLCVATIGKRNDGEVYRSLDRM